MITFKKLKPKFQKLNIRIFNLFENWSLRFRILKIGIVIMMGIVVCGVAYAASNIDTASRGEKWGWNDVFGWIDMKKSNLDSDPNNVFVESKKIIGRAISSIGDIMFDCATTVSGDTCATVNFQTNIDGAGNLSGWAWNDAIGWISMCGTTTENSTWNAAELSWVCPTNPLYQVYIEYAVKDAGVDGYFHGWAWNDVVGWINFNCDDFEKLPDDSGVGVCATTATETALFGYRTQTNAQAPIASAVLISSIFDIGTNQGIFNSIMWKGKQPSGTQVQFEVATAVRAEDLADFANLKYTLPIDARQGFAVLLTRNSAGFEVENRRYIRYRVSLIRPAGGKEGPQIDDIIINWSP